MSKKPSKDDRELTIRDFYPDLGEDELRVSEENLDRYLELAFRIYERIRSDPEEYTRFKALTASKPSAKMEERSKQTNENQTT